MTHFRMIQLCATLVAVSALAACSSASTTPIGAASSNRMATPDNMAGMDAQMKTMQDMHAKMMNAKTPDERNKQMAEHMQTMQDSMKMMGDMKGMQGMKGDMGTGHNMTEKRMEMMQSMMQMMMDRMPPAPAKQ